ncbi:MAG: hypothetical protein OXI59_06815 [Gemmatimonadota bacterium]|nr:hypothetical protein [Gemmatimonadota bacterium]
MKDAFAKEQKLLESCQVPFSFYQLVEDIWHPKSNIGSDPMNRLCTLMRKMKVKSFIREELELNEELLEEQDMAAERCKQKVSLTATRLTFFRSLPSPLKWNDPDKLLDDHLLGYAVIATLELPGDKYTTYLLESVVRPPSIWVRDTEDRISIEPITNYYVHNRRNFETHIGTKEKSRTFTLPGSFFAQQNNLTHVCAHAALRMAINSSDTVTSEKLTNRKINEILGIDFSSPEKCVGHIDSDPPRTKRGLGQQELEDVVSQLGGRTISADFVQDTSVEYDQFIYPFVESACPVILGIEGRDSRNEIINHVVSVLGHTLNSDRWEPEARVGYSGLQAQPYIPATGWTGHYIINDDNFGMYLTLPSDMLRNFLVPSKNPNLHARIAVAIVPSGVQFSGLWAEGIAVRITQFLIKITKIQHPPIWLKRLAQQSGKIVSRTLLQTKESYRQYIDSLVQDGHTTLTPEIEQRFENMPEHIWVSEITLPHLYTGNKHKLGDVIIRANATDEEYSAVKSFELAWFPGFIYFGSDHQILPWDVRTHVPLIREEETIPLLEW